MCNVKLSRFRVTNVSVKKKKTSITRSECEFVALLIQHEKSMRSIILPSVACPALHHFSTLSHKRYVFSGKTLLNTKYVSWFSLRLASKTFLILRRTQQNMIIMYVSFRAKSTLGVCQTWTFLTDIRKILNTKFHENPPRGSRVVPCGRTERRTDLKDEVNRRFSQFC